MLFDPYVRLNSLTLSLPRLSKNLYLTAKHISILLFFIDLFVNLLIIIFLDICAYHISLKRAFYAEKSDIQYIYLPLKLSSITRDIPVYP